MQNRRCYLCQNKNIKQIYYKNNRSIYRCLRDDLFFSSDEETKEKNLYGDDYFESSPYNQPELFNRIYFQNKLNRIKMLTGETKPNILDVGCGWGNFLQVLENNNLPYLGIDLSPTAVEICREKKLNCQEADLINLSKNTKERYSAITFFQVIEHLKNPIDYLRAAKKLLKKNGILLITTPNNNSPFRTLLGSNWPVYQTPSHYYFYSKKSLKKLFITAQLSNFGIKIDNFRFFSLDYILHRIFNKKLSVSSIINFPIPTDPWGDLEAIIINN